MVILRDVSATLESSTTRWVAKVDTSSVSSGRPAATVHVRQAA